MQLPDTLTVVTYGIGILGIGGGVFAFLRYSNYQATVSLQNDNIKALQDQAGILKDELESAKKSNAKLSNDISKLSGKLESYKEIPLQEISISLSKIAESNNIIMEILRTSAFITPNPVTDGLVVKPKPQITTVKVTS